MARSRSRRGAAARTRDAGDAAAADPRADRRCARRCRPRAARRRGLGGLAVVRTGAAVQPAAPVAAAGGRSACAPAVVAGVDLGLGPQVDPDDFLAAALRLAGGEAAQGLAYRYVRHAMVGCGWP